MYSRCTSSLWQEYSCCLPYPHFAASAGADVTVAVTKRPCFIFCFFFFLNACFWAIINQRQGCGWGVNMWIPHISVNQGQRFHVCSRGAVVGLWDSGRRGLWDASIVDFLQFFLVSIFLPFLVYENCTKTLTLHFGPLYKFILLHPPPLFSCHYQHS